jgi:hypothetical protein
MSTHYFFARVGPVRITQKCIKTPDAKLVFLHPEVSVGHVVHSCASGARNVDALFFVLGWDWCGFHKKHIGTSYVELLFLHPLGYAGHAVHPGREMSMHYFSCSCGACMDSTKSMSGHVTLNLCFASGRI